MQMPSSPCPTTPPTAADRPTPWRVLHQAVRGTSHRKANLPCQDALRWEPVAPDWLVVSLADGAGSASFADVGATIAARTALGVVTARLAKAEPASPGVTSATALDADAALNGLFVEAFQTARAAVLDEASRRQVRPRELATTLLVFVARPGLAAAAQVGDGATLVAESPERLRALTRPGISEYLNETTFLTSDNALEGLQCSVRRGPVRYAALFSDGLQLLALKLPEADPHARFFQPLFRFLDAAPDLGVANGQLREFLESPRITERADDDLSLLIASLPPPVSPPAGTSPAP